MNSEQFNQLKIQGREHLLEKRYLDAKACYLSASKLDINGREMAIVHHNLAVCYINLNQSEAALKSIDEAIAADGTYFKVVVCVHLELLQEGSDFVGDEGLRLGPPNRSVVDEQGALQGGVRAEEVDW